MKSIFFSPRFVLILIVAILVLHFLALQEGWYQSTLPIDKVYHMMGGFWVASLFFYLLHSRFKDIKLPHKFWIILLATLSVVALVGVLWEFLEFGGDFFFSPPGVHVVGGDVTDTLGDIFFDLVGGALYVLVSFRFGAKDEMMVR